MSRWQSNASNYDWTTWVMGLWRAAISGGAGAVAGYVVTAGTGLHHILVSMGTSFAIVGIVHMAIFLETHPGPDRMQTALLTAAAANVVVGNAIADAQDSAANSKGETR